MAVVDGTVWRTRNTDILAPHTMTHYSTGALWRHMLLAACIALWGGSASAHHSFAAEFDIERPAEFRGKVLKVELVNPHSWIHVQTTTRDGARQVWMVEGGNPNQLLRKGFTRNSLPVGTEIQVAGYQARDGGKRVVARELRLANGQPLYFQPNELPLPIRQPGRGGSRATTAPR